MTDSTSGCVQRWYFTSRHQHVRAISYDY
jgi:hypothetical protein